MAFRWAEAAPGLVVARPEGRWLLHSGGTLQEGRVRWGEPIEAAVSRYTAGFALWHPAEGDPQGAVWDRGTDGEVQLNVTEGWLAEALSLCAARGAPIGKWSPSSIQRALLPRFQTRPAAYWDPRPLAAALFAGREGVSLLQARPTRSVSLNRPEGEWFPLTDGLPDLADGVWPLGTWKWVGPLGAIWVHIPREGPPLLFQWPQPSEDDVDEPVGDDDDASG